MASDLILAWLHHLSFLGMATALAAQWVLLDPVRRNASLQALSRADAAYGTLAGLILIIGVSRVFLGPKGADFYLHNPVFWVKIAVFLLIGLISLIPTVIYARWKRQAKQQAGFQPPAGAATMARNTIKLQALGWLALPLLAAAMARGIGLG